MKHLVKRVAGAALGLSAVAFASGAWAVDDETLKAAEAEGSVVFYSSAPASALEATVAAFNAKFPAIHAEYYRSGSTDLLARFQAEADANRFEVDVIHVSSPTEVERLKDEDHFVSYAAPEYANYDARYVDVDNTWFIARTHLVVIGYNPTALAGAEAPKTWEDLTNPAFKDRTGILDPRGVGASYYWRYSMWSVYGDDYIKNIAANNPALSLTTAPLHDRTISGELVAIQDLNYLIDASRIEQGAPIEAVYPPEGSPLIRSPVGVVKGAPHPNAAKVFIDFLASQEGQAAFNSSYTYSVRKDVPAREGMKPLSEIKLLDFTTEELDSQFDHLQQTAVDAFNFQ